MIEYNTVARFKYNYKEYYILLKENKKLVFAYITDDNQFQFDLNSTETNMLVEVLKSLLINEKKSEFVRYEITNNNLYQVFYDARTKNYFWKSKDGIDNIDDNVYMNFKYNNIVDAVYDLKFSFDELLASDVKKFRKEYNKEYNKVIFYEKGKMFLKILLNAAICLSILATCYISYTFYNRLQPSDADHIVETQNVEIIANDLIDKTEETVTKEDYSWDKIKETIEANPNITNEEKEFIYKLKFVFDENHMYMDLDLILNRLKDLKFEYTSEFAKEVDIGGKYIRSENKIIIYDTASFKDVSITVFLHEFFHVLQSNYSKFGELSNEVFAREVYRRLDALNLIEKTDVATGYENHLYIYYYLAEILPQEELQRFQFLGDHRYLVYKLCNKNTDLEIEGKAWNLFDDINEKDFKEVDFYNKYDPNLTTQIDYFYNLRETSLDENLNLALYNAPGISLISNEGSFLLKVLGKEQYVEYADDILISFYHDKRTYFSEFLPETVIELSFSAKTPLGETVLEQNNETDHYTIKIDTELMEQYKKINYFPDYTKK